KPKYGNYLIKIDELQIDRIQQLHHTLKACCKTNFISPISQNLTNGIEVLDIGSGPGTWIFDLSSEFPNSKFTGIEIQSFMLPTIRPSNTTFIHNDVLKEIPFDPNTFDFIHMRVMVLCFTELQYNQIIKRLVELLKPDGYLELCEPNFNFYNMGPATKRIVDEWNKLLRAKSMNPVMGDRLYEFLQNNGLQVQRRDIMLPLSAIDGEIGALFGQSTVGLIGARKDNLMKQMNLSTSEFNQLFDEFIAETRIIRMYCNYTRIFGKKL
ncbi:S-adenosyl-L-methionine-dependent methyltransferase, partial [Glomus cerebriforme]